MSRRATPTNGGRAARRSVLDGVPVLIKDTGDPGADRLFDEVVGRLRSAGLTVVPIDVPCADADVGADELAVLVHEAADDLAASLAHRPGPGPKSVEEVLRFNATHADQELPHFGQGSAERRGRVVAGRCDRRSDGGTARAG